MGQIRTTKIEARDGWGPLDLPFVLIEGDPDVQVLTTYEGDASGGLSVGFAKVAPSTFEITIEFNESLQVIEGEASVQVDGGESVDLVPGTSAFLEKGSTCRWTVRTPFSEFYVLSA